MTEKNAKAIITLQIIGVCEPRDFAEYSDRLFREKSVAPNIPMSPVEQNTVGVSSPVLYGLISMAQMSFPGIDGQNILLNFNFRNPLITNN